MNLKDKKPTIYMIAGKARQGKDTVATMIQDIYKNQNKDILNLQYSSYIKEYAKKISDWDGSEEKKPRELLQQLGTNVIRNKIDQNFFVKKMIEDIRVYSFFFDVLTISDVRFRSEIDIPKSVFSNVIAIQVIRSDFDNGLTEAQLQHPTETGLDGYDNYDYTIINDGTLEELENRVKKIVEEVMQNEMSNQ